MRRMKASSVCISLLTVSLSLIAASGILGQKKEPQQTPSTAAQADGTVTAKDVNMGCLQSRNKIVMISRGAKGSFYTVKDKDGRVLASKIAEKEFEEKYPALFNQVKYGLAGNDASLRMKIIKSDAPVTPPK
jgi:hypothetical protein